MFQGTDMHNWCHQVGGTVSSNVDFPKKQYVCVCVSVCVYVCECDCVFVLDTCPHKC